MSKTHLALLIRSLTKLDHVIRKKVEKSNLFVTYDAALVSESEARFLTKLKPVVLVFQAVSFGLKVGPITQLFTDRGNERYHLVVTRKNLQLLRRAHKTFSESDEL